MLIWYLSENDSQNQWRLCGGQGPWPPCRYLAMIDVCSPVYSLSLSDLFLALRSDMMITLLIIFSVTLLWSTGTEILLRIKFRSSTFQSQNTAIDFQFDFNSRLGHCWTFTVSLEFNVSLDLALCFKLLSCWQFISQCLVECRLNQVQDFACV